MKTIIYGGTGFIGLALSKSQMNDREVLVVGRRHARPEFLPTSIQYVCNDEFQSAHHAALYRDVSEIIDCSYSTTPKTSYDHPLNDIESNLPRAVQLLEIAKKLPSLRKFIVVSSGGTVYGKVSASPISEKQMTNPLSPYGITKLAIEKYALLYHKLFGVPIIITRPSNAYGPTQKYHSEQGFVASAMSKTLAKKRIHIFGNTGTIRDYIYIDDLIDALVALLNKGRIGKIYNIGTGIGTNNIELLILLKSIAESDKYSVSYKTISSRKFDVPVNILDCTKIKDDTGWRAKMSLRDGLLHTWNYWLNNKANISY